MHNITFNLDVTFKAGTNVKEVKKYLRQDKKKVARFLNEKPTAIYVWCTVGDYMFKVNIGRKIQPLYWDFENKRVEKQIPVHVEINAALSKIYTGVLKEYDKQMEINPNLTREQIKEMVQKIVDSTHYNYVPQFKSAEAPKVEFLDAYAEFMKRKESFFAPATMKKYKSVLSILIEFRDMEDFSLTFDSIDSRFEERFADYLLRRKLVDNSISKYFDCVKAFMRWTMRMKYHKNVEFMDFKLIKENIPMAIALTLEELNTIYALDLSANWRLEKVKDMFYFQCLTGQRFSDIKNLRWLDLRKEKGQLVWFLIQKKGGVEVTMPLLEKCAKIALKYSNDKRSDSDFVFPRISDVKMNKYIKEVCQLAGIEETITISKKRASGMIILKEPKYKFVSTHTARRSFVTISVEKGMSHKAVGYITGHTNSRMIDRYNKSTQAQAVISYHEAWKKESI